MKTLLVPIDFSDVSESVASQAVQLAAGPGSRIILLHIVEPVASYVPVGASMDVVATLPPPIEPEDIKAPLQRLEILAAKFRGDSQAVECVCIVGLASGDIVNQAEIHKADCIVLGSHGHGALYHLFTGSVVTGVLKLAKCPVLVVPAKK